ncbi:MAG TPA: CvpA family protein [Bacillota bacterium]|nr:CvpA family protein [Bacillota bacterium]
MNWFDFLLIGIAAFYFIGGLIQGALKQIFNLFGFIIALALAFLGSRYLSGYCTAFLKPEYFMPYEEVLQRVGVTLTHQEMMDLAGGAITFLALLAVLLILFKLLLHWLTAANKIPVIGFFNRLGGALLGLLIGLLVNFAIINAVSLLPVPFLNDALDGSVIAGYLAQYLPPAFAACKKILIDFLLGNRAGGGV